VEKRGALEAGSRQSRGQRAGSAAAQSSAVGRMLPPSIPTPGKGLVLTA
jgi:hypothetical protein